MLASGDKTSATPDSSDGASTVAKRIDHPPGYDIPDKYRHRLEEVELTDKRSDEELIALLKKHAPVMSEKNIWGYWHSGVDGMPDWCRRNVSSVSAIGSIAN